MHEGVAHSGVYSVSYTAPMKIWLYFTQKQSQELIIGLLENYENASTTFFYLAKFEVAALKWDVFYLYSLLA